MTMPEPPADPAGGAPVYIDPVTGQPLYLDPATGQLSYSDATATPIGPPGYGMPPAYPPLPDYGSTTPAYDPIAYPSTGYPPQVGYQQSGYPQPGYPATTYPGYAAPGYGGYPYGSVAMPRSMNSMAIASMVVSITGVVLIFCYGIGGLLGLVGAILGHVGRRQLRTSGEAGEGMALAGIIIGWIVVGVSIAVVALIVVVIASAGSVDNIDGAALWALTPVG